MFHNHQVIDKQPVNIAALIVLIVVLVIGVFSTVLPLLQEAPIIPAGFLVGFGFIIIEVTIIWWLLQRSKLWPPVNNIWPLTAIICGAVAPIHLTAGGAIGDILAYRRAKSRTRATSLRTKLRAKLQPELCPAEPDGRYSGGDWRAGQSERRDPERHG